MGYESMTRDDERAEMPYSKQEIVTLMRRTGYRELADEAERDLPDPIPDDQLEAFAQAHGLNRENFMSAMGGSP